MDYLQFLLMHGKRNSFSDTSGTGTEDDEDDEIRKTKIELKQRGKAKELTIEVEKIQREKIIPQKSISLHVID